jgi:hypothetical protein
MRRKKARKQNFMEGDIVKTAHLEYVVMEQALYSHHVLLLLGHVEFEVHLISYLHNI